MLTGYDKETNLYYEFGNNFCDLVIFKNLSKTPGKSKIEFFVKLITDWKLLANVSKSFILDAVNFLDTPLPLKVLLTNKVLYIMKK